MGHRERKSALLPKVLVLDDDVNILAAFEDFFKKEQCTMVATSTAEEALKLIEEQRFDLLITDIRLKSNSGVTLFLNARIVDPHLPVIVITGYPETIDETTLKSIGADFFLLKPLELDKLRTAVRACLQKRSIDDVNHRTITPNPRKEQQ
jgi:DNA-binding NtrC family response regulator